MCQNPGGYDESGRESSSRNSPTLLGRRKSNKQCENGGGNDQIDREGSVYPLGRAGPIIVELGGLRVILRQILLDRCSLSSPLMVRILRHQLSENQTLSALHPGCLPASSRGFIHRDRAPFAGKSPDKLPHRSHNILDVPSYSWPSLQCSWVIAHTVIAIQAHAR